VELFAPFLAPADLACFDISPRRRAPDVARRSALLLRCGKMSAWVAMRRERCPAPKHRSGSDSNRRPCRLGGNRLILLSCRG
jgi:hypothetical protein